MLSCTSTMCSTLPSTARQAPNPNLQALYLLHCNCLALPPDTHRVMKFEAFARGFMMLCGGPAMHLFSATELERLVCGNPILDFSALQSNARYEGGYSAEHRVSCAPSSLWAPGP